MILEGLNNYYKCKQCAKQFLCNKEKCKPVLWHNTKNFGEIERKKKWKKDELK